MSHTVALRECYSFLESRDRRTTVRRPVLREQAEPGADDDIAETALDLSKRLQDTATAIRKGERVNSADLATLESVLKFLSELGASAATAAEESTRAYRAMLLNSGTELDVFELHRLSESMRAKPGSIPTNRAEYRAAILS